MLRFLLFLRQISWTTLLSASSAALAVIVAFITSLATTDPASPATAYMPAVVLALVSISLAILSGRE